MVKTQRSTEEVNNMLFGDETQTADGKDQTTPGKPQPTVTVQPQTPEPRLLKQKGLSVELEDLEPVPYYKKPAVQLAVLLTVALPLGWGLVSAFGSGGNNGQRTSATTAEDREKELLKQSLEQERKKNTELEIEMGKMAQKLEVVPARPKPTPQPTHVSPPPPRVAMAPTPIRTYYPSLPPPVTPVRREPSPEPPVQVIKAPTPAPAPKALPPPTFEEQEKKWLALSSIGNSGGDINLDNTSSNPSPGATATRPERSLASSDISQAPGSQIRSPTNLQPASYSASVAPAYQPASYTTSVEQTYPSANYPAASPQPDQPVNYGSSQVMVGAEASAEIDRTLSWSGSSLTSEMRIPIRLREPLKAIDTSVALPAGSYLIAQVNVDSAGYLQLVPTSVLLSVNGRLQPERPLPAPGSIVILSSQPGKLLRARASGGSSRRGNRFLSTIGSVASLAPLPTGGYSNGVYALDSLAQRSGQNYQYEPITYTLKQGTRCRVYVNKSFAINL